MKLFGPWHLVKTRKNPSYVNRDSYYWSLKNDKVANYTAEQILLLMIGFEKGHKQAYHDLGIEQPKGTRE